MPTVQSLHHLSPLALRALLLAALLAPLASCKSTYYGAWEKLGYHKRDILVERVEEARDEQQAAKEQFRDALEQFNAVVGVKDNSDLQAKYDKLRSEYEASESRAKEVRDRIASVESVATDLFNEWEKELEQYSSPELRRASEGQLRDTRSRYNDLIGAMRRAESKMDPVLRALKDQVLYLKHNLNARAIASLQGTATEIESNVATLIRDMEAAIREADEFIKEMGKT